MQIKHAIWKVGTNPTLLPVSCLLSEQQLEDMIVAKPEILSNEWMLIGRQELYQPVKLAPSTPPTNRQGKKAAFKSTRNPHVHRTLGRFRTQGFSFFQSI